jgi:Tripartite tricarboxylate transporter family receptor/Putative esterase
MKIPRRHFVQLAGAAATAPTLPLRALALDYPTRPVRWIVGFPPGGLGDIVTRPMGQWLSERLGQPFIIENRFGAAGNIATEAVVHAPADGYTLLLVNPGNATSATFYDKLSFNFIRDIAPVAGIIRHIAGVSNGGIAALHVAAENPQYFRSVTAFPGYMWQPSSARLERISKMCVFMYVGEHDPYRWHNEMKKEAEYLRAIGTVARYTVEPGQPHRLDTLAGDNAARLFDSFEESSKGCSR